MILNFTEEDIRALWEDSRPLAKNLLEEAQTVKESNDRARRFQNTFSIVLFVGAGVFLLSIILASMKLAAFGGLLMFLGLTLTTSKDTHFERKEKQTELSRLVNDVTRLNGLSFENAIPILEDIYYTDFRVYLNHPKLQYYFYTFRDTTQNLIHAKELLSHRIVDYLEEEKGITFILANKSGDISKLDICCTVKQNVDINAPTLQLKNGSFLFIEKYSMKNT